MNKLKENTKANRKCSICNEVKELNSTNFHTDKSRQLGYMYSCKLCERIRGKAKRLKYPRVDYYRKMSDEQKRKKYEIGRKYIKTPKGRAITMLKAYQNFDKKTGKEFNLTQDFMLNKVFKSKCVYCGDTEKLGCDRIYNHIGHIIENVVPCCSDCNIARMDNFTHEEMKIIGVAIKRVKELRLYVKELDKQICSAA